MDSSTLAKFLKNFAVRYELEEITEKGELGRVTPFETMYIFEEWSTADKPVLCLFCPNQLLQLLPGLKSSPDINFRRTGKRQTVALTVLASTDKSEQAAFMEAANSRNIVCKFGTSNRFPASEVRFIVTFLASAEVMRRLESPSEAPSDHFDAALSGSEFSSFVRNILAGTADPDDHDFTLDFKTNEREATMCLELVTRQTIAEHFNFEGEDHSGIVHDESHGKIAQIPAEESLVDWILFILKLQCFGLQHVRAQNHDNGRCSCNGIIVNSRTPKCRGALAEDTVDSEMRAFFKENCI